MFKKSVKLIVILISFFNSQWSTTLPTSLKLIWQFNKLLERKLQTFMLESLPCIQYLLLYSLLLTERIMSIHRSAYKHCITWTNKLYRLQRKKWPVSYLDRILRHHKHTKAPTCPFPTRTIPECFAENAQSKKVPKITCTSFN